MKFEIIDNRELDLAGKGYKWADALRQIDRGMRRRAVFMTLADFVVNRRKIEHIERHCL